MHILSNINQLQARSMGLQEQPSQAIVALRLLGK